MKCIKFKSVEKDFEFSPIFVEFAMSSVVEDLQVDISFVVKNNFVASLKILVINGDTVSAFISFSIFFYFTLFVLNF